MFDLTLTFDNGPDPDVTPGVLDVLARHDVKTTFFVVGEKIADPARRALAMRARSQGHSIGNHTYTHSVPLGRQPDAAVAQAEITHAEAVLGDLAMPERLFRPFGGGGHLTDCLFRRSTIDHLLAQSYCCVLWNAIPRDWADPDGWVDRALEQCLSQDWSLMVLHDLPTGAMRHLDRFLIAAKAAGAQFRRDFPPDCVPIRGGQILMPIDDYVSSLT